MGKIYGYARVSSKDQNLNRQIQAFESIKISAENIYVDKSSGKDFEREQYIKLKRILQNGDVLVIKSIDRLGRNYREIIQEWKTITQELQSHIKVIDLPLLDTTKSGKDLTGTFIADIVLQILSYVAEQERINIHQRQKEGIAAAKAAGTQFGRPKVKKPKNFDSVYEQWTRKEINLEKALKLLNLKRTTFFVFVREARKIKVE